MRHIQGIVQHLAVLLNPPEAAITILTDDAPPIVAIAAGDLALGLWGLRCGSAIEAEIEDTDDSHTLVDYALSQSCDV
jgi:hypothetical protein